ncbi:hypothetical protein [Kitasatospora kifunensis]|uniref:Ead/Ea22-like family protein n=1 Tax=Kitasatospora kifunensis TaxID=58351 RepID=A0A7W7VU70_KITKI|nr:hypothetical protein [Kitasatospora kifunensis]MBB4922170.1 hypothetical protein [Kitasatospora kifunensis]
MTVPLSDEQHAAIRAREQAATPGPWTVEWDHDDVSDQPFPVSLGPIGYLEHHGERDVADAEFIAHAREDVPLLLAEVDRLRAELATARADAINEAIGSFTGLANLAPDSHRAPGLNFAIGALMAVRDYPVPAARTAAADGPHTT